MKAGVALVLLLCFAVSVFASVDKAELLKQLIKAAGIYSEPARQGDVARLGLGKTVLVTGCNYGFLNHLHNFKCFADRLGMKFLVIAFDKQAHDYLSRNTTMVSYLMAGTGKDSDRSKDSVAAPQEFRSKNFNLITARKKEAVHDILALGYNVLFSDTDVAMVKDPVEQLLYTGVDYVHSLNYWCTLGEKPFDFHRSKLEGNTGFYFVRANNNTVKLWQNAFEMAPKHPRLDDQAVFWKVIRKSVSPPILPIGACRHFTRTDDLRHKPMPDTSLNDGKYLVTCDLDACAFSSGMISNKYEPELTYNTLMSNLLSMKASIMTLHSNYVSGNKRKMERMNEYGFWLAPALTVSVEDGSYLAGKCREYAELPWNKTVEKAKPKL